MYTYLYKSHRSDRNREIIGLYLIPQRESNTGTIIICTENIKWKFQGANVMAYLEEPKSRKQTQLVLEEEVKGRAYSFTLPGE